VSFVGVVTAYTTERTGGVTSGLAIVVKLQLVVSLMPA